MSKQQDNKAINFLEELGWLLSNYNSQEISSDIAKIIKTYKNIASINISDDLKPDNSNISFLVGILPTLFMNRKLFPKNEDIVQFAEKFLKVKITRPDKRSQYELIGRIMCEVTTLNDKSLFRVVNELKKYSPNKNNKTSIENSENSWNEVIRRLSGEDI